ncbi:helix-turn-helix protein [Marinilabilia salmonicolor]|jgi:DNA-binding XRE family transcriptional regulator|uniref:helix-turn-helix domain-containing protein n=1 Tax=Marinilabilia salmonicolor TaxID=989 RepID=UPI000D4F8734|nr:helix-turn-helix domain-containing protein [Marinilabilia salmonicolor]PRZ01858.1 helix-turn-helix protein [Marinilabilia salmonicolor]
MRQSIKIPRILKINWIKELSISVVFNNGESRIIDFRKVLKKSNVNETSPANILYDTKEFAKVELVGNTLSWSNVEQFITMRSGEKMKVPYEIGADILLKYSQPEKSELSLRIGELIREARLKSGLTQQDLALKSGTSRTYISKIENDRSDLEIATLRKIIETGLGRRLDISIK